MQLMYRRVHSCNPPLQLLKLLLMHRRAQSLSTTSQVLGLQFQLESPLTHRVMYSFCFRSQVLGTPTVARRSQFQPHLMCFALAGGLCSHAQGAAVTQPSITSAATPTSGAEAPSQLPRPLAVISRFSIHAPCSDQQVLYLLDSASHVVFVWGLARAHQVLLPRSPCCHHRVSAC